MHFSLRKQPSLPLVFLLMAVIGALGLFYFQQSFYAFSGAKMAAGTTVPTLMASPTAIAGSDFIAARIGAEAPGVEIITSLPPVPPETEPQNGAASADASPVPAPLAASAKQASIAPESGAAQPASADSQGVLADAGAPQTLAARGVSGAPVDGGSRAAGGAFNDPYFMFLAVASVVVLLFLNFFHVEPVPAALGSDVFRTLSSDTRVEMLHALNQRRKTLSELAKEAEISLPGAKQHLERLEEAGLVRKLDEGRKWKYYELTSLGKRIILEKLA